MNNIVIENVQSYLKRYKIFKCKIIVSVSGGIDSMILMDILLKLAKKNQLKICVLHFNHGLRIESDGEELFVKDYCAKKNIPFYSEALDVKTLMETSKLSLEMAAHELRYEQYQIYLNKLNVDYIATAHHKDDLVETILMKLGKSAGRESIQGLAPFRKSFIKPLYTILKNQIFDYQEKENLSFVSDISNEDISIERNFWRKEIIPSLKNYYAEGFSTGLLNTMSNLNWTNSDYKLLYKEINAIEYSEKSIVLDVDKLKSYFSEFLKRFIEEMMLLSFKEKIILNEDQFTKFITLLDSESGKKLLINGEVEISKQFDKIHLNTIFRESTFTAELQAGSTIQIKNGKLSAEFVSELIRTNKSNIEFIDFDCVVNSMHIRNIKTGDAFFPLGLNGNQKINRFLKSLKIPTNERNEMMVLCDGASIIWIIGYRIDEKYKVTKKTKKILKLEYFNDSRN